MIKVNLSPGQQADTMIEGVEKFLSAGDAGLEQGFGIYSKPSSLFDGMGVVGCAKCVFKLMLPKDGLELAGWVWPFENSRSRSH